MPLPDSYQVTTSVVKKEFPTVPTGMYVAKITDIEDLGEIESYGKKKKMLAIRFGVEFNAEIIDMVKWVSASWSAGGKFKPSTLYTIACAAFKKDLQYPAPHLNELIGKSLYLSLKLATKEDGTKKNIIVDFSEK